MEALAPFLQGVVGPLGALVLAVVALVFIAREYRKQVNERVTNLRADMEYERSRASTAEERLDAFREQNAEMTNVLKQAVEFAQRVVDERRR